MNRILRLAAILLLFALALTGCMPKQRGGDAAGDIPMPEPTQESENMILGETLPSRLSNVSLYYAMSDGATFSRVSVGIRADTGESLPEAAVNALLSPTNGDEMYFSTGDTRLLSCEYACGIATVNLSIDARNAQSEQEELALLTAIGNTLLGIDGVKGVNVLVGGQSESFARLPMGVQTEVIPSVAASYAQILAEREHLLTDTPLPVTRTATLYFPTAEGSWLVPELREVVFHSDDFANTLIDALKAGPKTESCAVASIPAGAELLDPNPKVETLPTGEHTLTLNFTATLANYLTFSGLDVWELAGSLALTTCSFLPEIDAVRILVEGDPITACQIGDTVMRFEDGLIRREAFAARVGSVATLYLAAKDGTLQPVRRAVSTRSALSPRSLLNELFFYSDRLGSLRFPVPDNVFADDVLGIQVSGQLARVNLSANFYRCCQSLNALTERNLIYCMVNTLCALDSVRSVRFYVEGLSADTLSGSIYLKSPLMPNPGIVVTPKDEGEP